jgi:hypothetical protein
MGKGSRSLGLNSWRLGFPGSGRPARIQPRDAVDYSENDDLSKDDSDMWLESMDDLLTGGGRDKACHAEYIEAHNYFSVMIHSPAQFAGGGISMKLRQRSI